MSFFEEFLLKRQANATNVFFIETCDPRRISQFKNFVLQAAPFAQHQKYIFDLQTNELLQIVSPDACAPVDLSSSSSNPFFAPGAPIAPTPQQLLALLRQPQRPAVLFASYAFADRHAQLLSDFLVSASHDDMIYRNKSTVVVFCSDVNIFPTIVRRLAYTIVPPPSTPEEREAVLRALQAELCAKLNRELQLTVNADIVSASSGLTLHDVETAALESFATSRDFKVEVFTAYKVKLLKECGLDFVRPSRGFESVGGYDYLKQYIMNRVVKILRSPDLARHYGLGVPKGVLLYGPPGTGKTWLARALAKEVGLPMVVIEPSTFLRGIVGETEARVKQVTAIIESLAPVIVFIDEFDQLTLSRQAVMSTDSGVSRRMTNMLLSWLGDENRRSFVVGATNYVSDVDPAFLRPGRLDEVIPVFYPDAKAREEILRVHTAVIRKVPLENINLRVIAEKTYLWTGAELEKLVVEAASLAMVSGSEHVTQEHFEEAMSAIEVNTLEREKRLKLMIQELKKLENVNRSFLKFALDFFERAEGSARVRGVVA
jgi:ATP-dependent 26S proteasome regulatory subunit